LYSEAGRSIPFPVEIEERNAVHLPGHRRSEKWLSLKDKLRTAKDTSDASGLSGDRLSNGHIKTQKRRLSVLSERHILKLDANVPSSDIER
jgi:hypothetical protein